MNVQSKSFAPVFDEGRIIDALEQRVGKPVITSNQALAWDALRLAGIEDQMAGYGALFAEH